MERWLDCDRTLFLDESLRSCRLTWPEIVSHAFLQTPVRSSGRARVRDGPWRYGAYHLRLFLVTDDGVREFATVLDFRQARYNGRERHNFRFDAVASVQVAVDRRSGHSLELTLVNGPARTFQLIDDPNPDSIDGLAELTQPDLDATGFAHTFSLLEGIAAEGRNWIVHDERRRRMTSRGRGTSGTEGRALAVDDDDERAVEDEADVDVGGNRDAVAVAVADRADLGDAQVGAEREADQVGGPCRSRGPITAPVGRCGPPGA